jgi:excinuclease ABC subunit C
MRDSKGKILYIGKALVLKHRVRSYFQKNIDSIKTRFLVRRIADIEWYTTANEQEALILEAGLVQKEKPPYNIRLKDDKNYPYLALTRTPYPRLLVCRSKKDNHLAYFGPYTSSRSMRQALDFINQHFKLRKCSKELEFGTVRGKPCIYFQMEQCSAPCQGGVPDEEYNAVVREVMLFLNGDFEGLLADLQVRMKEHVQKKEFESAARLRDLTEDIRTIGLKQHITLDSDTETDIVTLAERSGRVLFSVVFVRNGRIAGRRNFPHTDGLGQSPDELLAGFLKRYYSENPAPGRVLVSSEPAEAPGIQEWISSREGRTVRVCEGSSASERKMVAILALNTGRQLDEALIEERSKPLYGRKALAELGEKLGLKKKPRRIEGFDISNLGTDSPVASMVSFLDAKPDKSEYRKFHIKHTKGQNDFAMIRETVGRRYQRLLNEKKPLPDLVLIDGGPGQLANAKAILDSLGLDRLPVISLAKKEELIFRPGIPEPLRLDRASKALFILQAVRDEAHRFAITFHKKTRSKKLKAES